MSHDALAGRLRAATPVAPESRLTLVETPSVLVELVRFPTSRCLTEIPPPARRQIMFVLDGAFRWSVGARSMVVDPNQLTFIRDDEATYERFPTPMNVLCLLVNVAPRLANRLWRPRTGATDPFDVRIGRATPALQARYCAYAAYARNGTVPPELLEEDALGLVGAATREAAGAAPHVTVRAARVYAERAKQLMAGSERMIGLADLARRLDVSPTYLTDAFRRSVGIPVVRYQLQLRVMRAMQRLPASNDLTALALELGFSSHSHFSMAFRAATGITPSRYRELVRP